MAMTKKRKERLQVCEKNWMRRIAGVKRIDKRRMEELSEEVGKIAEQLQTVSRQHTVNAYSQTMRSNYLRGIVLSGFSLAVVNASKVVEGFTTSR